MNHMFCCKAYQLTQSGVTVMQTSPVVCNCSLLQLILRVIFISGQIFCSDAALSTLVDKSLKLCFVIILWLNLMWFCSRFLCSSAVFDQFPFTENVQKFKVNCNFQTGGTTQFFTSLRNVNLKINVKSHFD